MDRSSFLKLLAKKLYPILRAEGFKGSGTTLRRHDGCFHHVFHLQGSSSSVDCYMNLGAHIEFLPAEGGGKFSPEDFSEPSCSFRTRLESRQGDKWTYGENEAAALATIEGMIEAWKSHGHLFFNGFRSINESENLAHLVQELDEVTVHPYRALIGARIAAQNGDKERALRIAESAIERVGEHATTLRANLHEFVRALTAER
jgi:hypothetical protein